MIVVKLMGGLGNQMFQYAAGRHLAHIHNTELKLDLSFLKTDSKGIYTQREYALDIFNLKENLANETEINSFKKLSENRYRRLLFRKFPFFFNRIYVTESGNNYNREFTHFPINTYLDGYWQSEKYFAPVANMIRKDFNFKEPLSGLNKEIAAIINETRSVSLHVRRGDYVANAEVLNYHGVCPPSYYSQGLDLIKQKEKNAALFIFSDDTAWCKKNLVFDLPTTYIDHNQGHKSFEDMRLMSLCKHNIIANSSFSWWGAWLNTNADKMVVAPKMWFKDQTTSTTDIYPENFIKI